MSKIEMKVFGKNYEFIICLYPNFISAFKLIKKHPSQLCA